MKLGVEYLTSNRQVAYPFREDASGLARDVVPTHGSSALFPREFVVDALVEVPYTSTDVYLYSIVGGGTSFTFTFTDQLGALISEVVSTVGWSGTFVLLTFTDVTANVSIKLVVDRLAALAYLAGTTADTFQDRLPFETRAVHPLTRFVQSLDIYTALPDPPEPDVPGAIVGNVVFQGGYNMVMEQEAGVISLGVSPGAGAGVVPCDDQPAPSVYRGLMQLIPDQNGNVKLSAGDDCYTITPVTSLGKFIVTGNCTACCTCDDYENAATALKRLLTKAQNILHTLDEGHSDYELGVTKFNNDIAPGYTQPVLKVNGSKGAAWSEDPQVRGGSANWVTFVVTLKNMGGTDFTPTTLTLAFTSPTVTKTSRQARWEYDSEGKDLTGVPAFSFTWATPVAIKRGRSMSMYILAYQEFPNNQSWTGVATLVGTIAPATASTLTCNFDIQT